MEAQTRKCQNCKHDFTIEPNDFGFYEKIKVPPPTFCPDCRRQRRWAWRNNVSLYNRKCNLCEKSVISIYAPDSGLTIYCNKCWWSDKWDPKSYGVDYDFSKHFFTQFRELLQKVPQMAIVNDDGIASLNCEYTHDWWFSKNCYMCISGWHTENTMYSHFILAGKNMVDCNIIRSESEWLYECFMCSHCYQVKNSEYNLACIDSQFIFDCRDCSNCFMSYGLRGKKYHFKNKLYSKEQYEEIIKNYNLDTWVGVEQAQKEFDLFLLSYPRRFTQIFQSLNCTGNLISQAKNSKNCFIVKNAENCSYCDYVGDTTKTTKDCYDLTTSGGLSESYEGMVLDHSQLNLFGVFSVKSQDIQYTQHCHNVKHAIGCVGVRSSNYCIFNKQYTKEEYQRLLPKIIEHMNEMPYTDKQGIEYKYGEFYPIEHSPFGYSETFAQTLVPLKREEALKRGYKWQDNIQRTTGKETLKPKDIPESINDVKDDILEEVLACIDCGRNYKIVVNELNFYRKMNIPIPRRCFHCRHATRLARQNPLKLWHRQCMCTLETHDHRDKCPNEFETSYAPDRPEMVYCEKCYQKEVY